MRGLYKSSVPPNFPWLTRPWQADHAQQLIAELNVQIIDST